MTLNKLSAEIYEWAKSKGWWEEKRDLPTQIALQHSELSEVLEEYRKHKDPTEIYFSKGTNGLDKPEGIPIEYVDLIIRVLDTCGHYGIDINEAVRMKMEYNKTRPIRHGDRKC